LGLEDLYLKEGTVTDGAVGQLGIEAAAMDTMVLLLDVLDIAAKHGAPLVRVRDLTGNFDPNVAPAIEAKIDKLLAQGVIAERSIGGDRSIGIYREVERFEKERIESQCSPMCAAEVMLHDAALHAHPGWVWIKNEKEGFPPGRWERTDPKAPASDSALVEWFEINHPVEAKRITKQFTTGKFAAPKHRRATFWPWGWARVPGRGEGKGKR
jgi:hypothetical protein